MPKLSGNHPTLSPNAFEIYTNDPNLILDQPPNPTHNDSEGMFLIEEIARLPDKQTDMRCVRNQTCFLAKTRYTPLLYSDMINPVFYECTRSRGRAGAIRGYWEGGAARTTVGHCRRLGSWGRPPGLGV